MKERATAVAQSVADRLEQFRERMAGWREQRSGSKVEQGLDTQPPSHTPSVQEQGRAGPEVTGAPNIGERRQAFREHFAALREQREAAAVPAPAVAPEPPAQQVAVEKAPEQKQEQEQEIEHSRGFEIGM